MPFIVKKKIIFIVNTVFPQYEGEMCSNKQVLTIQ